MRLSGILVALVLASAAWAQIPAGVEKVASVEGITEYRLNSNGLRVLLFPDKSKQTVTVNITYLVGSRHESYGETGMAHLLEHLVFKGTPRHQNIAKELTDHGAQANGTTSWDRTNYYETVQATEENLRWALDMEADRMVNSFIAKKDLDSEMTVVRNEFEAGENSPSGALFKATIATAYTWHNYGKPVIGSREDIENVSIERLQAFYRKYYQPDNAVLTVAGKLDEEATLKMIVEYFGKIPKPSRVIDPTYTAEPVQEGERFVTVRRVADIQAVYAMYHIPSAAHPDADALDVLGSVLSNPASGRLYKALVETKKATSAFGSANTLREPGFFQVSAIVAKDKDREEAKRALLAVLDGIKANPITNEEVQRAKTEILKQVDLSLSDTRTTGLFISEYIASGDWRLLFLSRDRVQNVTAADVQRVALQYLKPSNRTIGELIPEEKPDRAVVPATPDIISMVKDYKGRAALAEGEAFDTSPSNIDARTERSKLKSGMSLELLSKQTRGDKVNAVLLLHFGDLKSLNSKATVGQAAGSLLDTGTASKNKQQIREEFDRLKARVNINGGASTASASIETTRENLPAVMRLVAEILKQPAFPADELELWRQRLTTGIENGRREPAAVVGRELQRHYAKYEKGDPRYVGTIDEDLADIKAVTIDQVKQFHKDFYGASHGELAVVGDFDAAEIKKVAEELFGDWKSPRPFTRIRRDLPKAEPVNKSFETPDKKNAVFAAAMPITITDEHPDYPALLLGNYMLGGGFLSSRLAVRIRQKEGLSYGIGAGFSAAAGEQYGTFTGNGISAPQNTAKVEAAFLEEVKKALETGFTDAEVEAAKKGWLQSRQVQRSNDAPLAIQLANNAYNGRTMEYTRKVESQVDTLTTAKVNEVFKKYMDASKLSIFKAGDFSSVNKKPTE